MALVDYTTFDDIRAVLGVPEEQLEDATISLDVYEFNLTDELESVDLTVPAEFITVAAIDQRNAVQDRFFRSVKLFAAYAVAKQLLASLPMFGPKEVTDGKASVVRFAMNPYKDTVTRVLADYERFRERLLAAFAALSSSTAAARTQLIYAVGAPPAVDPVTGT